MNSPSFGSTIMLIRERHFADLSPDEQQQLLAQMIQDYGPPLQAFICTKFNLQPTEAEDLVQEFLLRKLLQASPEKNLMVQYFERKQAVPRLRFRDYLRVALRNSVIDQLRRAKLPTWGVDREQLDDLAGVDADVWKQDFDANWASNIIRIAVEKLREECEAKRQQDVWFMFRERVLVPLETGKPVASYDELCERGKLKTAKIAANRYQTAIRKFNRALREIIRDYLSADELIPTRSQVEDELRDLRQCLSLAGMVPAPAQSESAATNGTRERSWLIPRPQLLHISENPSDLWKDQDLIPFWQRVLDVPLPGLMEELAEAAPKRGEEVWRLEELPEGVTKEALEGAEQWTFRLLMSAPQPPLDLLKKLKDLSKTSANPGPRFSQDSEEPVEFFPYPVNVMIYTLATALARIRWKISISRDGDQVFRQRASRLVRVGWLDAQSREILEDWISVMDPA
jgi:DNA-directed RNA polymerase specialized sigma24 family protein